MARILRCEPEQLAEELKPYASAALEEYVRMFLGERVFFIEEHQERCEHLRSEVAKLSMPPKVHLEILEGSFVDGFPGLIDDSRHNLGNCHRRSPSSIRSAPKKSPPPCRRVSSSPRCEVLVYFPVACLARFGEHPEFAPILNSLYGASSFSRVANRDAFRCCRRNRPSPADF